MSFLKTTLLLLVVAAFAGCTSGGGSRTGAPPSNLPAADPFNHDVVLAAYIGRVDEDGLRLMQIDPSALDDVGRTSASLDLLNTLDAGSFGTATTPSGTGYVALKQTATTMRIPNTGGPAWDTTNCGAVPTSGSCSPISMQNMIQDFELQHPYVEFTSLTQTDAGTTVTGVTLRGTAAVDPGFGTGSIDMRYPDRLARAGVTSGTGGTLDRATKYWSFVSSDSALRFSFAVVVKGHIPTPIIRSSLASGTSDLSSGGSGYGGGTPGNATSGGAGRSDISDDGRYTVFQSVATNLDPSFAVATQQIYRRDNSSSTTSLVSLTSAGAVPALPAGCTASAPTVSGTGQYVAFLTNCRLVAADTDNAVDAYVRDMTQGGTTILASVDSFGTKSTLSSLGAAISQDGTHVVFANSSTAMLDELGNNCPTAGQRHIWLYDVGTGTSFRVDRPGFSDDTCGAGNSQQAAIDQSGGFVVYSTNASNLGVVDSNGLFDIYAYDVLNDTTARVSVNESGAQLTGGSSSNPAISTDGAFVAYQSLATNILTPITSGSVSQIYVASLTTPSSVVRASRTATANSGNGGSQFPSLSSEGRFVAFVSTATNLDPGDSNGTADVYVRDLLTGDAAFQPPFRISITEKAGGSAANVDLVGIGISDNSNYVSFSGGGDLVPPFVGAKQAYRAPTF